MKLKQLRDDDSQTLWIQERPVNDCGPCESADPDCYALLRLEYTDDWPSAMPVGNYYVTINIVSPEWVGEQERTRAVTSCGWESPKGYLTNEELCEILLYYGHSACIYQKSGNNKARLLKAAHQELQKINIMFGFYMDRPLNAIGSTGWDWVRGDILRPVREYQPNPENTDKDHETKMQIMQKMGG